MKRATETKDNPDATSDDALSDDELQKVAGGVPNAGTTNTVMIHTGDAVVKNSAAAIASSSS